MFENIYTTKMSSNKKQLQNRFAKIRQKSSRASRLAAIAAFVVIAIALLCATVVMAALNNEEATEPIALYSNGKAIALENKPFLQDNTAYFPLREVLLKLGVFEIEGNELLWDNGTIYITVAESAGKKPVSYSIKIGSAAIGIAHNIEEQKGKGETVGMYMVPAERAPVLLVGDKAFVPYAHIDYMLNRGISIKNDPNAFEFVVTINGDALSAFISQGFMLPIEGEITNTFGEVKNPATNEVINHNGIDIAAPVGAEVKSAIYGTITETGYDAEKGYFVIIERDNIKTVYSNLAQDVIAGVGDEVVRGQPIAKIGNSGKATDAHLHFEVLINGKYYNPELIS